MLETNHCLPLSHMAKKYIWFEEKNQRINDFSIGYMMNQNLNMNKSLREQVNTCLENTFSTSTMEQISKISSKTNTRALALVIFHDNRKKSKEKVQSVELCNIYNYRQICFVLII